MKKHFQYYRMKGRVCWCCTLDQHHSVQTEPAEVEHCLPALLTRNRRRGRVMYLGGLPGPPQYLSAKISLSVFFDRPPVNELCDKLRCRNNPFGNSPVNKVRKRKRTQQSKTNKQKTRTKTKPKQKQSAEVIAMVVQLKGAEAITAFDHL